MTMTHILHHASCPDGHGAAWVAQKFIMPGARIIPVSYGDPVPDSVDGEVVWVLDFCFEPEQLRELVDRAGAVRILDHHHTAAGHLAAVEDLFDIYTDADDMPAVLSSAWALIDQTRSGVGLVQNWFGFDRQWLNNIEDRDLWRFHLEHTADVFAAVTSHPYTIEAWDEIDATPYGELVAEGRAINRYRNQLIRDAVESAWIVNIPGIGHTPITPCPYSIGSDVAGELAQNHPGGVGGYFMMKEPTVRFGLRSRKNGPNVADLAKELFGGGGHPAASGFEVSREEFNSWH
jgi:hypothetical protein